MRKYKLKESGLIICLILLAFLIPCLSGCIDAGDRSFVGTWYSQETSGTNVFSTDLDEPGMYFIFYENEDLLVKLVSQDTTVDIQGGYQVFENINQIHITLGVGADSETEPFNYQFSNNFNTLVITSVNGYFSFTLTKVSHGTSLLETQNNSTPTSFDLMVIIGLILFLVWFLISGILSFYISLKYFKLEWSWINWFALSFVGMIFGGLGRAGGSLINPQVGRAIGGMAEAAGKIETVSRLWGISRTKALKVLALSWVMTAIFIMIGFFSFISYFWGLSVLLP